MLSDAPVRDILNDNASVIGAACCAFEISGIIFSWDSENEKDTLMWEL